MDLAKLKTEIQTDPLSRGYSAMTHEQIADSLNAANRTDDRDSITGGEVLSCVDRTELEALQTNPKYYLERVISAGTIPLNATIRQQLRQLFSAGTNSRQALVDLLRRVASRAEELKLGRVTTSDVADALRS